MRSIHLRIALPMGLLLAMTIGASAWVTWSQLRDDAASSMRGYAGGLNRMLVAALKESMKKNDREHVQRTIADFGELAWVRAIRVIDKQGTIAFASNPTLVGKKISRASETCRGCHRSKPVPLNVITVRSTPGQSDSVLQAATAIRAEQACANCHHVPAGAALGVMVLDLDMAPLMHDVRGRAARNLWILVAASILLLSALVFVVRKVVLRPLHRLSAVLAALRMGKRLPLELTSPEDEIDEIKDTLGALSADLEGRQLSAIISRQLAVDLCGHHQSFMLVDAGGTILLGNDAAQAALASRFSELGGKLYSEIDEVRDELWLRAQSNDLVLHPEAPAKRSPDGADLVLMAVRGEDDAALAFIEIGKHSPTDPALDETPDDRNSIFPPQFMHSPYRSVGAAEDRFFQAVLLLASLHRDQLAGGVLDFDRTFAQGMRLLTRTLRVRELFDEQADICNVAQTARNVLGDFRRAQGDELSFHAILYESLPLVGHAVLLRQLLVILLEAAVSASEGYVVVFLQRQQQSPKFFLGVWTDSTAGAQPDPTRWAIAVDIATRFGGCLEIDARYDLGELRSAHPGELPELGLGVLFVVEFPHTLG